MSIINIFIQSLANVLNWLLVRSKVVPESPIDNLNIDINKPTFYISFLSSSSDLAALRQVCKKLDMPDPQSSEVLNQQKIKRYIPIRNRIPLFGQASDKSPAIAIGNKIFDAIEDSQLEDLQVIPVTILWGRNPGKEQPGLGTILSNSFTPSWLRKLSYFSKNSS